MKIYRYDSGLSSFDDLPPHFMIDEFGIECIEEYFDNWIKIHGEIVDDPKEADWFYVPIPWGSYFVSRAKGGHSRGGRTWIQNYVDGLPYWNGGKKHFTIGHRNGGFMIDLGECIRFSANAYKGEISIPYGVCRYPFLDNKRDVSCSFMGIVHYNTKTKIPYREQMIEALGDDPRITIIDTSNGKDKSKEKYIDLMARSRFSLCPRGYGISTYRVFEACQLGSIPIMIADGYKKPFDDILDWNSFSLQVLESEMATIPDLVDLFDEESIEYMSIIARRVWEHFFCHDSTCHHIMATLSRIMIGDEE